MVRLDEAHTQSLAKTDSGGQSSASPAPRFAYFTFVHAELFDHRIEFGTPTLPV